MNFSFNFWALVVFILGLIFEPYPGLPKPLPNPLPIL